MMPLVSAIIATYNYGRFLPLALDSALQQTYRPLEIVVIDDGSTDDTPAIMQRYRDARISYHRMVHGGQPKAKNQGARLSQGEYLAYLDADDQWLPAKIEKQVALFDRNPSLGLAYCRKRVVDEQGFALEEEQPPLYHGPHVFAKFRHLFFLYGSAPRLRTIGRFRRRHSYGHRLRFMASPRQAI
jgi:glycosyltransferase involved in cell wall biosynthesis